MDIVLAGEREELLGTVGPIANASQEPHHYQLGRTHCVLQIHVHRHIVGELHQVGEA